MLMTIAFFNLSTPLHFLDSSNLTHKVDLSHLMCLGDACDTALEFGESMIKKIEIRPGSSSPQSINFQA